MTALRRKPETRYCPSCARTVPASHMRIHEGYGKYIELDSCKDCACSSRLASKRALMVVNQGVRK